MKKDEYMNKATPVSELVDKIMKAYGLDGKMLELQVVNAWPELMGGAIAHRTTQIYIKNKTLFLTIDSSVMREELLIGKSIIIQRINQYAKREIITDVWFS